MCVCVIGIHPCVCVPMSYVCVCVCVQYVSVSFSVFTPRLVLQRVDQVIIWYKFSRSISEVLEHAVSSSALTLGCFMDCSIDRM